ncbi:MAG: DUF3795 domain-containing protein [Candidatus Cloacimonetes bacterium]|nr:DUF3795 domain-containing protein [Candidatus Cloacimonadota bacterium]
MLNKEELRLVSPCGIYCAECAAHKVKDNPELMKALLANGMNPEDLPCPGCRAVDGNCPHLEERCENYICAEEHGVDMCYECGDFPCNKLHPALDRANVLPHNMKLYSQCFIKKQGLQAWKDEYLTIRKRYYLGKITYGKGPLLDEE